MLRPLRITLEVIAGFVGLIILLGLLLLWRLSTGPVRSAVLTPYVEAGLERIIPNTQVKIDHTLLTWDNISRSVAFHADGLRVTDAKEAIIAEVPSMDVRLSGIGILFGQFLPIELLIDHPQIKLERKAGGSFYFGGVATESERHGNIKNSLQFITSHLARAYFTQKLEIKRTVFDVHDAVGNRDWSVHVPSVTLERVDDGLAGRIAVDVTQKDQVSTVDVHYLYDRKKDLHRLVSRFNDITPSFFAGGHPDTLALGPASIFNLPLTGEILLDFDSGLNIASGSTDIRGGAGTLQHAEFWDQPRAVKSLEIKGAYDQKTNTLAIPAAVVDFGGPTLTLTVNGTAPLPLSSHDLDLTLTAHIKNWPLDQYRQLWPKPIIPNPSDWVSTSLSKGMFDQGEMTLKAPLKWDDLANITPTEGKGKIKASGARVKYLDGMPEVEGVDAEADFDLKSMSVQITSGHIGEIKILPFTMNLSGFEEKVQYADIPLKITGSVPSVLQLIDTPRLGYAKAVGLTPNDVAGKAEGTVTFRLPLLKELDMADVDIKADVQLVSLTSSKLVEGIDITQGNMNLALDKEGFKVQGPATINKVPLQILWQQNFKEDSGKPLRQAQVTGSLSAEQWQSLGIDVFKGTRGIMPLSIDLKQMDKNKSLVSGKLDLTAAEAQISQLNWKKSAGASASVKFTAEMPAGKEITIKSIEMSGPQLNIKGRATMSADAKNLLSLNLNPMIAGRTNASLNYAQPKESMDAVSFDVIGESLDISGLKGGKEQPDASMQAKEFRIKLAKLYTSETGLLANVEGHAVRDAKGWSEINLHGMAEGGHALDVNLALKEGGRRVFSVTCEDFGKALKSMGFTDTVTDGNLKIRGESDPEDPRAIVGTIKVGHFTVGHLPALVVLMNAASPFGFVGLFTGSMEFDRLTGKFRWEGDTVKLSETHAAGAAVGINIAGKVDMGSDEANLNGTMVPFSMVNNILGSIPLLGDVITGGEGQGVLAVSYSINGPLDDPSVSVNPVSLLTPGFLRNLFFGDDDSDEAEEAPAKP
ncbi:MAG: AsmA-like C-terminal domain-containing protein [Alphaproteobacteria bacterium]|nr:AsmA-like C-terminal domain-containing protein [Alphaproteobacteria bacterium]